MKRYIYHTKDLRCKVSENKETGFIDLEIQLKCCKFFWERTGHSVSIEFRSPDNIDAVSFPFINNPIQYTTGYGNQLEVWLLDTFDLRKRVNSLFEEFKRAYRNKARKRQEIELLITKNKK